MSQLQYNPTITVVMTYKPEVMNEFIASFEGGQGSFDAFYEKHVPSDFVGPLEAPETFIFRNGRNANFLSLTHTFNRKDQASFEIEIIDPQGMFEKSLYNVPLAQTIPVNFDPYQTQIDRYRADILQIEQSEEWRQTQHNLTLASQQYGYMGPKTVQALKAFQRYNDEIEKLEDKIAELEQKLGTGAAAQIDYEHQKIEMLNDIINSSRSQMQKPIYVTYGVGTNLDDWSPPQCYGIVNNIDYKFNSQGVRSLKLHFHPSKMHPNLVNTIGLAPFGKNITNGLLVLGRTPRIFSEDSSAELITIYKDIINSKYMDPNLPTTVPQGADPELNAAVETIFNSYTDTNLPSPTSTPTMPSIHYVVKEAITSFIKAGTGKESVFVILPDLDKLLWYMWAAAVHTVTPSITYTDNDLRTLMIKYSAFKLIMNQLGLTVLESARYNQPNINLNKGMIGSAYGLNIEECTCKEDALEWWNSRDIRVVMECDFDKATSFLDKLDQVAVNIQTAIQNSHAMSLAGPAIPADDLLTGYTFEYMQGDTSMTQGATPGKALAEPVLETDMRMIRLMQDAGIVLPINNDSFEPPMFWGDRTLFNNYIQGHKLDNANIREEDSDDLELFKNRVNSDLQGIINPIDQILGVNFDYLQNVYDYVIPIQTLGPFGTYVADADGSDLLGDTNVDSNILPELKKENPLAASRMPVFTFGDKNPNVLNVDIDINHIYSTFLRSPILYTPIPVNTVRGMVTGANESTWGIVKSNMEAWVAGMTPEEIADGTPPQEFVNYIKGFWVEDVWGVDGQVDWDKVMDSTQFQQINAMYAHIKNKDPESLEEETFENISEYNQFMWDLFKRIYRGAIGKDVGVAQGMLRVTPSPNVAGAGANNLSHLANRIANQYLAGTVTTTPLFNLSTMRRAFNRPCLLLCVEPAITPGPHNIENPTPERTWFSGYYNIMGYKHTINTTMAQSQFFIQRNAVRGAPLQEEKDKNTGGLFE